MRNLEITPHARPINLHKTLSQLISLGCGYWSRDNCTNHWISTEGTNLTNLGLDSVQTNYTDALDFSNLTRLTQLSLFYRTGQPDDSMSLLNNLTSLRVPYSNLSDRHISCLRQLTRLDIQKCIDITDAAFVQLTNIRSLDMGSNTNITNSALLALSGLVDLSIGGVTRIQYTTLERLPLLRTLSAGSVLNPGGDVCHDHESHFASLTKLTNITALTLDTTLVDKWLYQLTGLRALTYGQGRLPIRMTQLTALSVRNNGRSDLTPQALATLTGLQSLTLRGTSAITDDVLSRLTGLTQLDLLYCPCITDKSVSTLTRLSTLRLFRGRSLMSQMTPQCITGLTQLTSLHTFWASPPTDGLTRSLPFLRTYEPKSQED
jgi:hypothetical protein